MRDVISVVMLRRIDSHRFGLYKPKLAPYLRMSEILRTIQFNVTLICLTYKALEHEMLLLAQTAMGHCCQTNVMCICVQPPAMWKYPSRVL